MPTTIKAETVSGPSVEPLTLDQVKKQLEISSSDTTHDLQLAAIIQEAREQWEHDTDSVTCYTTLRVKLSDFYDGFELPKGPVSSITSIQYYDGNNNLQTYSSANYSLHKDEIRLGYQVSLPAWSARWDAWVITYKSGYSQDASLVPAIAKRAMMLLVAHYFENRDMLMSEALQTIRPYEALVKRFMRASYP